MKATRKYWLSILALIALSAQSVMAQSGRRKTPAPSASPSPGTQATTPADSAQPATGATEAGPKFHPAAFIVCGIVNEKGGKTWGPSDVDYVADEIKFMFNLQKMPAKIIKAGKQTRELAVARAKQETENYVLWMEINEKTGYEGLRPVTIVEQIDYVLLMPQTGAVVRQLTVDPSKIVQTNDHGTALPSRTQGYSTDLHLQLKMCGFEMARVLEFWM